MDVIFTYTLLNFVPPDAVAPFNIIEIDTAKSARVESYSLLLEFQEATALSQQLSVLTVADSKNLLGGLEVVGEMENRGTAVAQHRTWFNQDTQNWSACETKEVSNPCAAITWGTSHLTTGGAIDKNSIVLCYLLP